MDRESALKHWRLGVERASYAASLAERRYRAVDPANRLVARGLERAWEESLRSFEAAKAELARREEERPRMLSIEERDRLGTLGPDLAAVWTAATTTPRDRKELLGTLIEEVIVKVERDKSAAQLTLRWKGGALTEINLGLPRSRPATVRTDEDTIALVRRLAVHYPDTVIAGILNRQGRRTARGHRFEGNRACSLRTHWKIPCFVPNTDAAAAEVLTIKRAATALGVAPSTIHRGQAPTTFSIWKQAARRARGRSPPGKREIANKALRKGSPSAWRFSSRIAALARRPSGRFADFSEDRSSYVGLCLKWGGGLDPGTG